MKVTIDLNPKQMEILTDALGEYILCCERVSRACQGKDCQKATHWNALKSTASGLLQDILEKVAD